VAGEPTVVEEAAAFFVIRVEDPDDWLVRFEKDPSFPARESQSGVGGHVLDKQTDPMV
jgi:hypothetical protein